MIIEEYIKAFNCRLAGTADRAERAVTMTRELDPDLIIMDIFLNGDKTGIDAMREIRATSEVPVIYISGNSDPYYMEQAKETHFSHFLFKPLSRTDLQHAVDKAFKSQGSPSRKKVAASEKWSWPFSLFF